MKSKLLRFLFFFLVFLIIFQLFGQKRSQNNNPEDDILISSKSKFSVGKVVTLNIKNQSGKEITIENNCPENPLLVEQYQNGEWVKKEAVLEDSSKCDQTKGLKISPDESTQVNFGLWNYQLFNDVGKYRVSYQTVLDDTTKKYSREFEIVKPSLIKQGWIILLYKPIFNTLFFLVSKLPGHNLGWAIILLTVIIKLILLGPNQKALKSQKQLQKVQPQLDALKQKYKDDPQRLAQETMAIWKKHKVSPMGSCLPMLIQFPVLIALFYVVRDGLNVANINLFYAPLKDFDLSMVNTIFLGLDLTKVNTIILPLIVGGLQFVQINLSLAKTKKTPGGSAAAPMMNNMMKFMMPVMIAIFSASLPAAVGFYWGTSTLFAIGQQLVVNYSKN